MDATPRRIRALHFSRDYILLKCKLLNEHEVFLRSFFFCLHAQQSTTFRAVFLEPRATKDAILPSVLDCDNLKGASKRSSKSISRPLPIARRIFVHSSYQFLLLLLLLFLAQTIYLLLLPCIIRYNYYPYFPPKSNYRVSFAHFSFS